MTNDELKQKFTEFCNIKDIERRDTFIENAVAYLELLKQYYGNINIGENYFEKDDTIYIPNKIDVQNSPSTYSLDEYVFNRLVRNVNGFYHSTSNKGKELLKIYKNAHVDDALGVYDPNFNIQTKKPNPFIFINDSIILQHIVEFTQQHNKLFENGSIKFEYELMPEYMALSDNHLTEVQKEDLIAEAFNKEYFRTLAHELWHASKAAYYNSNIVEMETGELRPDSASRYNIDTLETLYDCLDEIIHEYQISVALNLRREITITIPNHRTFIIKGVAFGTENCQYSDHADTAELIELISGKDKLFFGSFINRNDFVTEFNNNYYDIFSQNNLLTNFYKDYLSKIYDIRSNKPWDIISAVNYFLCESDEDTYIIIEIKLTLQEALINCIIKNIQAINPKTKNISVLKSQLEYVKNLPAKVQNVLMVDQNESNYKTTNVLTYLKLEDICLKKQKQIEAIINYRNIENDKLKESVIDR
ncbi:MAG: hypothetical protein WCX32_00155 [Clostridia bacterium]|jgi:hypothetical protein|nr:hypothetical protein [Clostridia bacterium]MDD4275558.1 hypothetical protein [Clostridia bacterium]